MPISFLEQTGDGAADILTAILANITSWISWLFGSTGPVATVIDFIVDNPFLWVFIGLSICTIGIKVVGKLRRMF